MPQACIATLCLCFPAARLVSRVWTVWPEKMGSVAHRAHMEYRLQRGLTNGETFVSKEHFR